MVLCVYENFCNFVKFSLFILDYNNSFLYSSTTYVQPNVLIILTRLTMKVTTPKTYLLSFAAQYTEGKSFIVHHYCYIKTDQEKPTINKRSLNCI